MDGWIALARGPGFRVSLAVCALGLAYHVLDTLWMTWQAHRRAADRELPIGAILAATVAGLVPARRGRPLQTLAALAFHAGVLLVPLFYVGHVTLWQPDPPLAWPALGPAAADLLSLAAIGGLIGLLLGRWLQQTSRELTSAGDAGLLLLLLLVTASGYWTAHPGSSPIPPRAMVLTHMLAADLALCLTPFTKIVHCALAPLNRLASEVAWHFPAESGAHVALALGKESEPI